MGLRGNKCYDDLWREQEAKIGALLTDMLHVRFPP
jgi:hypothetical protein